MLHFESFWCLQGVEFAVLLACIFGDPAAEIWFFLVSRRHQLFFRFPMVSRTDFGGYFEPLLRVLGGSFKIPRGSTVGFKAGGILRCPSAKVSLHVVWAFSLSSEMQSFQFALKY